MIVRRGALTSLSVLIAFAALLVTAAPASAHAHLVKINPANKAAIEAPPTWVTLTFDENMREPAAIVVTDPTGARVDNGAAAQVVDKTARARLRVVDPGRYTVAYRVVSADGHPVTGQSTFTYRPAGSATPSAAAAGGGANVTTSVDPHANHKQGGIGNVWVIALIAGLALLGGLTLLTNRRRGRTSALLPAGEDPA